MLPLVSVRRRAQLLESATIDGDTTDVEVYGPKKQDAVYNYQGRRAYRPHIVVLGRGWVTLAADLMRADEDPRPVAAGLLDRAGRYLRLRSAPTVRQPITPTLGSANCYSFFPPRGRTG